MVSNGYLGMVKTIPQMYRFLYTRAERATEVGHFRTWIHQFTASNLRDLLIRERPDVVVCTHAFPCGVMAEYKRQFPDAPPVVGVVTDFAVHAYWIHENIEQYAVATPEMRAAMAARGIDYERVHVTGIPIKPGFGLELESHAELCERLALPPERRIVLLMGGGLGIGPLVTMLDALQEVGEPICAVAIAGKSARGEARVRAHAARMNFPVRVERFVENVDEFMHASDVLITKPGGLTASEALAARLPLLLYKPLPGQEERNTRYLVQHGAALRAKTPRHLAGCVEALLRSSSKREKMRESMAKLAKPNAAREIADIVRSAAERKGAPR